MNDRTKVLSQLAQVVATSAVDSPLSLRMCEACVSILGVDGGSITLAYADPQRVTLCATDEPAARLEDLQEVMGEGPSYEAHHRRRMVLVSIDGGSDERWPLFSEAVKRSVGRCEIYAIPIIPGPETMGVVTLYQIHEAALPVDPEACQFLINAVGVALIKDPDVVDDDRLAKVESWSGRARVNQATGMVMVQLGLVPDDALALLRAHAYAHSTTLTDISTEVIERRLDFSTTD